VRPYPIGSAIQNLRSCGPRLEQGDAVARIGGEPVGQHATGGTRADDDEVELAEIH
jgi:hypothetical protein